MNKRKHYESKEDRRNEEQIVKVLSERLNASAVKLKKHERLDFILYRHMTAPPQCVGITEVKRRSGRGLRFPEWFIAEQKWSAGVAESRKKRIPFFILFEWDEGIFEYRYTPGDEFRTEIAGRTKQTRDEYDVELMVYIPSERFIQRIYCNIKG